MDFASAWIWNRTDEPCTVTRPVSFRAYYADGTLDRNAAVDRRVSLRAATLPARMSPVNEQSDSERYLVVLLSGAERDDPTSPDGECHRIDERTPATLVVELGTLVVRIHNVAADGTHLYGCHGRVFLAGVSGPLTE